MTDDRAGADASGDGRSLGRQLTRRRLLAAAGTLGAVGLAEFVPIGGVEGWTPAPDTWPLDRYDLANTAGTTATPPTPPTVDWRHDGLAFGEAGLVVGPDRVYAGGGGLVALDRATGAPAWQDGAVDSGRLALRNGTLYSGTAAELVYGADGVDGGVLAFDTATGEREWGRGLPGEDTAVRVTSLHVADGTVFAGLRGGAMAFDAASGRRRWFANDRLSDGDHLAIHGGSLYAVDDERLGRFDPRDLLDIPLGEGPAARWQAPDSRADLYRWPVVTDDRVIGVRFDAVDQPAVVACRPGSGAVAWRAGEPPDETRGVGLPLAVGGGSVLVALGYGDDAARAGALLALEPADGTVRWRTPLAGGSPTGTATAVADGTALVGLRTPEESGSVRAYDLADGTERWRVALPAPVRTLAPVEGTVFATDRAGSVFALR